MVFIYEITFVCFVLYYIGKIWCTSIDQSWNLILAVEEVMEIKKAKLEYFQSAWNVMDCVVILISLFNIIIAIYTEFVVTDLLKPLLAEPQTFGDFDTLSNLNDVSINVLAINVFFAWLKLFKYISFNRTMNQLNATLARFESD